MRIRTYLLVVPACLGIAFSTVGQANQNPPIAPEKRAAGSPVDVIDSAALMASGLLTIGDILQDLPSQLGGVNTQANNGGDGSTRVDFRGIGTNRTLVLLNGHRIVAGGIGADPTVDLNLLPLAMVSRIEVTRGGGSALYGSDAISAVVNIITRSDIAGSEAKAYLGTSSANDGTTYGISVVTGNQSDHHGFHVGASYEKQEEVWAKDRSFSEFDKYFDFQTRQVSNSGSVSLPNGLLVDFGFDPGNALYQSEVVANCPSGLCTRDGNGSPWRDLTIADQYNFQSENYLITPNERYGVFAAGTANINDIELFGDLMMTRRESSQRLAPTPLAYYDSVIASDSIYDPYGLDLYLARRVVEAGPRKFEENVDMLRFVIGARGSVGGDFAASNDWRWEFSFDFGRVSADRTLLGNLLYSHLNLATGPSFIDDNGVPRCGIQGPAPGPADDQVVPDCVPADLLGLPGSITPEMLNYIGYRGKDEGRNEEIVASAQVSGHLVDFSSRGYVSTAIGVDLRHELGEFAPDNASVSGDSTVGYYQGVKGNYDIGEAFVELSLVPPIATSLTRSFSVDAAMRAYDGTSDVSGVAWQAGFQWITPIGIGFRGNYSNSYRVPSISEFFQPHSTTYTFPDPCDANNGALYDPNVAEQCAAEGLAPDFMPSNIFVPVRLGGNRTLQEETAENWSIGLLYESGASQGLSISLDYFDISVGRGVASIPSNQILDNCYFHPDSERHNCDLIVRNPATGAIRFVDSRLGNFAAIRTTGYDAQFNWTHEFERAGRCAISIKLTYLDNYEYEIGGQLIQGVGVYDLGVHPRLKTQSTLRWDRGALDLGLNVRSISGFKECEFEDCFFALRQDNLSRNVSDNWTFDVFENYMFDGSWGKTTLRIGINNLTNQSPSTIYGGFYADSDMNYDFMGRFGYVGLQHQY